MGISFFFSILLISSRCELEMCDKALSWRICKKWKWSSMEKKDALRAVPSVWIFWQLGNARYSFLPPSLPSFLPSCLPSCLPPSFPRSLPLSLSSFLPSLPLSLPPFLPPSLSLFLSFFPSFFLSSFLPFFLSSFLPFFLSSFLSTVIGLGIACLGSFSKVKCVTQPA